MLRDAQLLLKKEEDREEAKVNLYSSNSQNCLFIFRKRRDEKKIKKDDSPGPSTSKQKEDEETDKKGDKSEQFDIC